MVGTGAVAKNIFRQVEQILSDMYHQSHGYFVIIGIGNVGNSVLPNLLVVLVPKNLDCSAQEVQSFYERVISDIIYKAI